MTSETRYTVYFFLGLAWLIALTGVAAFQLAAVNLSPNGSAMEKCEIDQHVAALETSQSQCVPHIR